MYTSSQRRFLSGWSTPPKGRPGTIACVGLRNCWNILLFFFFCSSLLFIWKLPGRESEHRGEGSLGCHKYPWVSISLPRKVDGTVLLENISTQRNSCTSGLFIFSASDSRMCLYCLCHKWKISYLATSLWKESIVCSLLDDKWAWHQVPAVFNFNNRSRIHCKLHNHTCR